MKIPDSSSFRRPRRLLRAFQRRRFLLPHDGGGAASRVEKLKEVKEQEEEGEWARTVRMPQPRRF